MARAYVESFPAIRVVDLNRRRGLRAFYCRWINQDRDGVGEADFIWRDHRTLHCDYFMSSCNPCGQMFGEIDLRFDASDSDRQRNRWRLRCPACARRTDGLYLQSREWRCRLCHGLAYRSQRMSAASRLTLRKQALEVALATGRPKGMHRSTVRKRQEAYRELRARMPKRRERGLPARVEVSVTTILHDASPQRRIHVAPPRPMAASA